MASLLLLRHGEAGPHGAGPDRERALTEQGRHEARRAGEWLRAEKLKPFRILCSPARRTRETAEAVMAGLGSEPDLRIVPSLYAGPPEAYFDAIAAEGGDGSPLLVIGHNPAIHMTAHALAGTGGPQSMARLSRGYPTAGLAVIEFRAPEWADIAQGHGTLVDFWSPGQI